MPLLQEVKHTKTDTTARERLTDSHDPSDDGDYSGIVVKTTYGSRFQKMRSSIHICNPYGTFVVDAIELVSRHCTLTGAPRVYCLAFIGGNERGQIFIEKRDFHALFHAFNPTVNDKLNLLSTSEEEEVSATGSDQEPVAGTNNAHIRG